MVSCYLPRLNGKKARLGVADSPCYRSSMPNLANNTILSGSLWTISEKTKEIVTEITNLLGLGQRLQEPIKRLGEALHHGLLEVFVGLKLWGRMCPG
mmetsp:Transcript_99116/g.179025  ORF Transcript_99116/g.179025 Transcript_99116/m.179025 type:complete len:97 (+) Transcript_99116:63-353(+)